MDATVWLKGLRIPLYWASGAPIVLSAALAARGDALSHVILWALGATALIVFEIGVNLVAEISDESEGVLVTQQNTWIPTGPYLIKTTGLSQGKMLLASGVVFAAAGAIGLNLAYLTGFTVILSAGAAGFILTVIYAFPPAMLGLRGIGEPVPFIAFGPLPGIALYFLMTGHLSPEAAVVTLPAAFWITAVRYAHHLPDRSIRRGSRFEGMHRKRIEHSREMLTIFVVLGWLSIIPFYLLSGIFVLIPLIGTVPLSAAALRHSNKARGDAVETSGGTKYYVLLQFAGSILTAMVLLL